MDKTPTYFDEENEDGTRLPATFPEEALTDGDVLYAEPFDELGDLPGHVPMGSERGCILGLNVELLRKGAKLSKVRFCALVGISRPMLDKIERGGRPGKQAHHAALGRRGRGLLPPDAPEEVAPRTVALRLLEKARPGTPAVPFRVMERM